MDGLLPDVDYVNQRMGNLLDDHSNLSSPMCQPRRAKFHRFFAICSRRSPLGLSQVVTESSNICAQKVSCEIDDQGFVQRIHAMRMRCQWYQHQHQRGQHQHKYQPGQNNSTDQTAIGIKESSTSVSSECLISEVAYTTPSQLHDTIKMQQRQLLARLIPYGADSSLSSSSENESTLRNAESHHSHRSVSAETATSKPHKEWVMKKRSDGSTFVTRRERSQFHCRNRQHRQSAEVCLLSSAPKSTTNHSNLSTTTVTESRTSLTLEPLVLHQEAPMQQPRYTNDIQPRLRDERLNQACQQHSTSFGGNGQNDKKLLVPTTFPLSAHTPSVPSLDDFPQNKEHRNLMISHETTIPASFSPKTDRIHLLDGQKNRRTCTRKSGNNADTILAVLTL